jgi:hypothetical protein
MNTSLAVAENQPVRPTKRMTSWLALYAALLREFIDQSSCLDSVMASSQFGTMALELFARQVEHNAAYRQLCRLAKCGPRP